MGGPARTGGYPQYDPTGTVNFNPVVYSGKLVEKFYKTTVFGEIATTDYEGDIVGYGSQVVIRTVPDITVSTYIIGAGLTPQYPSRNSVTLNINQAYSFNVGLNIVDVRQSDVDLSDIFANDGSIQLKIAADADMLVTIPTQVDSTNTGTAAGADSANINLGSLAAPVQIIPTGSSSAGVDYVIDHITWMGQCLDENNVSDEGRWLVAPPWYINLIKRSDLRIASLAGDGVSILRNGKVGVVDRFSIYQSRNVAKNTGSGLTTSWSVMFGHSAGLAFAAQIVEAQMIDNPSDFGYLIRGLMVFGFQVIGATYVGTSYCHP
jgi:hypothetical protein